MGCRLTSTEGKVAMFDSVSGIAFGPVLDQDEAEDFFRWFNCGEAARISRTLGWWFPSYVDLTDPRSFTPSKLEGLYAVFSEVVPEQEEAL